MLGLATVMCLLGLVMALVRGFSSLLDKYHFQFEQWLLTFGGIFIHLILDPGFMTATTTAFCLAAAAAIGWKILSYQESGVLKKHELEYLRGKRFRVQQESVGGYIETKIEEMEDDPEPGMRLIRDYFSPREIPEFYISEPNTDSLEMFEDFGIGRWEYIRRRDLLKKVFGVWMIYDFFTSYLEPEPE